MLSNTPFPGLCVSASHTRTNNCFPTSLLLFGASQEGISIPLSFPQTTWHLTQFYPLPGTLPRMWSKARKVTPSEPYQERSRREKPERKVDAPMCAILGKEHIGKESLVLQTLMEHQGEWRASYRNSKHQQEFLATRSSPSLQDLLPTNISLLCLPGSQSLTHIQDLSPLLATAHPNSSNFRTESYLPYTHTPGGLILSGVHYYQHPDRSLLEFEYKMCPIGSWTE